MSERTAISLTFGILGVVNLAAVLLLGLLGAGDQLGALVCIFILCCAAPVISEVTVRYRSKERRSR